MHNGRTRKNKLGKYWKRYISCKEGFYQLVKMLEIATAIAEAMPQARDGPEGRKLKRKWAKTREGCQAHIVFRSIDDGKFEITKFH